MQLASGGNSLYESFVCNIIIKKYNAVGDSNAKLAKNARTRTVNLLHWKSKKSLNWGQKLYRGRSNNIEILVNHIAHDA